MTNSASNGVAANRTHGPDARAMEQRSGAVGASSTTRPGVLRLTRDGGEREFAAFVTRNRAAIHGFVEGTLRGTPDSDVDRDAVVQEALLRAWRDWPTWPAVDARRQAYLRRVLRLAGLDAIRAAYGRDGRRPRAVAIDLAGLERCDGDPSPTAAEVNRTLARQAASHTTDVEERIVLADALGALTELERRAVLLSAQGLTDREVADRLNVTHQRARTLLMDARALLRSFTDHATEPPVDWPLQGSATSKRHRRLQRRHLEHCATCRAAQTRASSLTGLPAGRDSHAAGKGL